MNKTVADQQLNLAANPFRPLDAVAVNSSTPLANDVIGQSSVRQVLGVTSILISPILGGLIHWQWGHHGGMYNVLPFYVIAPFTVIGLSAFITVRSSAFLVGAARGCLLVTVPTFAMLWYDTFFSPPGAAG